VIGNDGSLRPLLSAVIAGSFQFEIWLVKIFASVVPDSRRLFTRLPLTRIWYVNAVPPATIAGTRRAAFPRCRPRRSAGRGLIGDVRDAEVRGLEAKSLRP